MIETLRSLARAAGHADLAAPRRNTVALAYEGVRTGRRAGGWRPASTSGNAEMGPALSRLRDNAEDLVRNNAFAAKSVRRWCRRVVGYGITPQADTGNARVNALIDQRWKDWVPACCSDIRLNMYALQRMIVRTTFVRGECLIRLWDRLTDDPLPIPLQIQVLEPDFLDNDKTIGLPNGGRIINGVQFDPIGRVEGFWLFGDHPGDSSAPIPMRRGTISKFIPAQFVIHHVPLERAGDARGVTRFSAVMNKLRDVDEYAEAEIERKKIEACLTAFIGQDEGPDGPTAGPVAVDSDGNRIESFEPGMVMYGSPGAKPEFFAPTSSGDYSDHKKTELKEICAGLDQPYVVVGNDIADVNYSSYRGGLVDERDSIDEYRWLWLIPQVLDRVWARFIDKLFAMGEIPDQNYGVKWNPPPFDLLDRKIEAEADEIELRIGKKSWPQLIGEQGIDPEKQATEIETWKPRLEAAGVIFTDKAAASKQETNGNNQATSPASRR